MSERNEISIENQLLGVSLDRFDNPPDVGRRKRWLSMDERDFVGQNHLIKKVSYGKRNMYFVATHQ